MKLSEWIKDPVDTAAGARAAGNEAQCTALACCCNGRVAYQSVPVPSSTREWPLRPRRLFRDVLLLLMLLWLCLLVLRFGAHNDHCQLWISIAAVAQLTESRTWIREGEEARGVVKPVTNEHPQHALWDFMQSTGHTAVPAI